MKYLYKIGKLYIVTQKLADDFEVFLQHGVYYNEDTNSVVYFNGEILETFRNFDTSKNVLFLDFVDKKYDLIDIDFVSDEENLSVWRERTSGSWIYKTKAESGSLKISKDYRKATYYRGAAKNERSIIYEQMIYMAVECALIMMGYLIIHASCIEVNKKAVLFSAPSGTGKSTRAVRWVEAFGAQFISGDRPIIDPNIGTALGAPWDGKEDIHMNSEVPIIAFNVLQRAEETRVSNMSEHEKRHFLATQVFVPLWDPVLVTRVFSGINKMIKNVVIYRLACDQTIEAAKETYDILFPKEPESLLELLKQLKMRDVPKDRYKYHMDTFLDFKSRKLGVPYMGVFELTPLCNLDCKMCYVHLNKSQVPEDMMLNIEQWKHIMKEAHDLGMIKAKFTGGECLTYPGFDELFLYLQSMGVEITVFTNGLLLDERRIEFFKEHPVRLIQVTLYGSDDTAYSSVTGVRCFSTIYHNIMKAKKAGLPITIAITPNKFVYYDIENLLKKVEEMGIDYNINSMLFTPREETNRERQDLSTEQYLEVYKTQAKLQSRH